MEAADRSRLLADLASALTTASTDLDRVVECAARAASELIGDGGVVRLANDEGVFDRAAVYHPDPAVAEMLRWLLPRQNQRADAGFAAEVIQRLLRPAGYTVTVTRTSLITAVTRALEA
jgi:hypothetical protein